MTPPTHRQRLSKTLARVEWNRWAVSLLSALAILWAIIRPDMALSCLVVAVAALAIAIMGRSAR